MKPILLSLLTYGVLTLLFLSCVLTLVRTWKLDGLVLEMRWAAACSGAALEVGSTRGWVGFPQLLLPVRHRHTRVSPVCRCWLSAVIGSACRSINHLWMRGASLPFPACPGRSARQENTSQSITATGCAQRKDHGCGKVDLEAIYSDLNIQVQQQMSAHKFT